MTQPFDLTAARSFLESAAQSSEFTSFMGTRLRHVEAGQVEIEIDLRPPLTQHHGYAHGAVVGYLADTASAWAAATLAGDVVTAEYKLNLLAPARGELLWARAEVLRVLRSSSRRMFLPARVAWTAMWGPPSPPSSQSEKNSLRLKPFS